MKHFLEPFGTQEHPKGGTGKKNAFNLCFRRTLANSGDGARVAESSFVPFELYSPHTHPTSTLCLMEPAGSASQRVLAVGQLDRGTHMEEVKRLGATCTQNLGN